MLFVPNFFRIISFLRHKITNIGGLLCHKCVGIHIWFSFFLSLKKKKKFYSLYKLNQQFSYLFLFLNILAIASVITTLIKQMWVKCKTKDPRENENLRYSTYYVLVIEFQSILISIFNPGGGWNMDLTWIHSCTSLNFFVFFK